MEYTGSQDLAYHKMNFLDSDNARTVRILSEYLEPKTRINELNIEDTIVFFGSARIKPKEEALKEYEEIRKDKLSTKKEIKHAKKIVEMSKYYEEATDLSYKIANWAKDINHKRRFVIVTGGGQGIMEAANKGANKAGEVTLGLNITLPHEQHVNPYVDIGHAFQFHYFFMRKFWFSILAKALIIFPGGFGTMDELFELLTLSQTKTVTRDIKIIMYDKKHWEKIINFDALVEEGMVSEQELSAIDFCSTTDEVYEKLTTFLEEKYIHKMN